LEEGQVLVKYFLSKESQKETIPRTRERGAKKEALTMKMKIFFFLHSLRRAQVRELLESALFYTAEKRRTEEREEIRENPNRKWQ
jgi:hypothetical protein